MSSRWMSIGLIIIAAAAGYGVTARVRTASSTPAPAADAATEALLDWLNASPEQREALNAHDPAFGRDLQTLRGALNARRFELATALEDTSTPEQTVRSRADAVIDASAALQRRIVNYLLSVREHLTAAQRQQLFSVCAECVRRGGGGQWRHGQEGGRGRGPGNGRGFGGGSGGRGRGWEAASRPSH